MIRVASYNIRKALGTDRRRKPERILDVLAEVNADIVAIQEADRRFGQRKSAIPINMIAEASHFKTVALGTREHSIGWHGNAILIRDHLSVLDADILEIPSLEPRGAVLADIRTPSGDVRIIGMHLDLSGLRRRQQIRAILKQAEARQTTLPTILMGDCNEWSRHGGSLTEFAGHQSAPTAPSFHSRRPVARLDRIFTCDAFDVLQAGTHHSLKARFASDHLPVWADVSLR